MPLLVLLSIGWLFGPVLVYDLVRTARRSRYLFLRVLYTGLLFFLLTWIYWVQVARVDRLSTRMPANEMADFAASFFYTFLITQFTVVVLLTPAYTAGAIAEEKERRTLEYLLATDLRNREIVLGKLTARLLNLGLLVLAGLPILALLQFLGGVDPNLVLGGFAATAAGMVSLAALGILNSVYLKKARDAIVATYMGVLAYVLVSLTALLLLNPWLGLASIDLSAGAGLLTVQDLIGWFNAGNPLGLWVLIEMQTAGSSTPLDEVLLPYLRNFLIFHGLVTVLCCAWAVLRVRAVALKQTYGKPHKGSWALRLLGRPLVGDRPMIWKEVFAEPGLRFNWLGRVFILLLIAASFVPGVWILGDYLWDAVAGNRRWGEQLGWEMNMWGRIVGTLVGCLMLLGVAVRAAGAISGERDRQTLDSLLTSPLDSDAILGGKWLGSILSVRWAWLWLGLIWALGIVSGGLHLLALPFVVAAWCVFAAFLAILGLWFSAVSKTTLRAIVYTVLTTVGVALGHWVVWMCCVPVFAFTRSGPDNSIEFLLEFESFGLTPPITLGALAFHGGEFETHGWEGSRNFGVEMVAFSVGGLVCYALAAGVLWGATSARFRDLSGRTAVRRPDAAGPSRTPWPAPPPRGPEVSGGREDVTEVLPTDGPPDAGESPLPGGEQARDDGQGGPEHPPGPSPH